MLGRIETDGAADRGWEIGGGGIARPFSTQFISVTEILSKSLLGFKKVTVEASEITVGYMTV